MNDRIKLMHGDCLELMKEIPDCSVDLILTDPPYQIIASEWDTIIPFEPMWEQFNRIVKNNNTPILLFGNEPFTSKLICSNLKGFKYRLDWDKKIPSGMGYAKYRPMQQTEDISVFTKNGDKTVYNPQMTLRDEPIKGGGMQDSEAINNKGWKPLKKTYQYKNPVTLIQFLKVRQGSVHPTQKPVELLEYLIKTYSNENDIVLDATMGSGSTGVASVNTNRKFVGIELDDNYFKIAKDRIEEAINKNQNIESQDSFEELFFNGD